MTEMQALDQAVEIVQKYVNETKVDSSEEIMKIIEEIEKVFDCDDKKLERIEKILAKCPLKETKKEVNIDEADKFLLKGLLLKSGLRFTKKLKEAVDFENDKIDFEELLKSLLAKKKRAEKANS